MDGSHCKWCTQWARFKECLEGLCQLGKLYYTFPRWEKGLKYGKCYPLLCICVCLQLCNVCRPTEKQSYGTLHVIATCTSTCTYVECSHFARAGSMLYTENQSDEN